MGKGPPAHQAAFEFPLKLIPDTGFSRESPEAKGRDSGHEVEPFNADDYSSVGYKAMHAEV